MTHQAIARLVAASAATTLAVGALTIFGTSIAGAAPATIDWWDGNSHFTRTVSNTTPAIGETVTVTTKFERGNSTNEKLNWVKDFRDPCLNYVPNSATMNGNPVEPYLQLAPNFIAGDFNATSYQVTVKQTEPATLTAQYTVGGNCALGTALGSGMEYSGSLGAGYYTTKGPQITANKANTTTTLAPVTGARVGQSTSLTASVTGGAAGNPVEFYDGATQIGQGNLDAAGAVSFAWTPTTAGGHALTAKFLATATANQSVSAVQNAAVSPADVVTTTTVTGPATGVVGQDVALDVQVSPAPVGGTVQFKNGTDNLGGPVTLDAQGKGSIAAPLALGSHTITAVYSGSNEFLTSTSGAHTVAVTPANVATETTVTGDTTGVVGTDVALSAHVSPAPALGGKVQFKNGTTDLGGPVDLDAQGNASIAVPLAAGNHAITAVFTGFNEHQASTSAAHNVSVTPANVDTTTSVTGPATAVAGTDVTLGVQVSPVPSGGTVQFKDGATNIGGPVTLDNEGKASITQQFASAGARSITAVYSGVGEFQPSTSGAHNVNVTPANVATETTVTGDTTGVVGTDVALTAHVSPSPAVGGKVQFKNGTTDLGGPVDLDAQGNASIAAPLAAGNHAITAVFTGFNEHQASTSAAHNVTVTPASSADDATATVLILPVDVKAGVAVNLVATVSPAPNGGTVQFKNGADNIGQPVELLNGTATRSYAFPTAGDHQISAVYSGTAGYLGSSSESSTVPVTEAPGPDTGSAGGSLGNLFGSS